LQFFLILLLHLIFILSFGTFASPVACVVRKEQNTPKHRSVLSLALGVAMRKRGQKAKVAIAKVKIKIRTKANVPKLKILN
jgi:hypothetical protein